jgi:hypothetical protein
MPALDLGLVLIPGGIEILPFAQCTVGNRGWSFVDFAGFAATLPRSICQNDRC